MDQPSVPEHRLPETALALRARRASIGLPQTAAAPLLGIAPSTLAQAEAGYWKITRERLAELLSAYDRIEAGA